MFINKFEDNFNWKYHKDYEGEFVFLFILFW